jgi:hypothetical protein
LEAGRVVSAAVSIRPATKKVRVLFVNCPRLDTLACSYLILSQNTVQPSIEFSVHHHWLSARHSNAGFWTKRLESLAERSWLSRRIRRWAYGKFTARIDLAKAPTWRRELGSEGWAKKASELIADHDEWWKTRPPEYGGRDDHAVSTVIVTETLLHGAYYASARGDVAVITLANWGPFAPPSALEYVLSRIQRYSTFIAFSSPVGSHYSTKGCIWDFDANVEDVRAGILTGFICEQCRNDLSKSLNGAQLDDINRLIKHEWIGRVDEPGSVASNLRSIYGYDLSRMQGLNSSLFSDLIQAGAKEVIQNIAKIAVYVSWTAFLIWLVTHRWLDKDVLKELLGLK